MRVELLAPAGSYESMTAAYAAGADAVYIGGKRFGARAFAQNPDEESLKRAIDYAHLRDKKLYLTVNTLFKDSELSQLYEDLEPLYREGLDAVIVQDLGALSCIRKAFPKLEIHASTQMGITGPEGAAFLKEQGASRVVTARELSLEEIRSIHEEVDIEIESFVHGALCFCYSGQCLFSSMIGGRSGNRGRCAQPCRLPYQLIRNEKILNKKGESYLMSPKDICALELIPKLIESGIDSFKIEGRMKNPQYTAGVVVVYRKYLDRYLEKGGEGFRVSEGDLRMLMDLYNRGGFSGGYYQIHNGPKMMSMERPNHWGTVAGRVLKRKGNTLQIRAVDRLQAGDVLEIRRGADTVSAELKEPVEKHGVFSLAFRELPRQAAENDPVYRTRNAQLMERLDQAYVQEEHPEKIYGKFIFLPGKPVILELSCKSCEVSVSGEVPQAAKSRPLTREDLEKQLRKTGGSGFVFDGLTIEMEDGLFLPIQSIKEVRRKAVLALQEKLLSGFFREELAQTERTAIGQSGKEDEELRLGEVGFEAAQNGKDTRPQEKSADAGLCFAVSLEDAAAAKMLCRMDGVNRIYIDGSAFEDRKIFAKQSRELIALCHEYQKECFYIMPWIFRDEARRYFREPASMQALFSYDGVLIRNQEEHLFLKKNGYAKTVGADWNLYTWNRPARAFWRAQGLAFDTVPVELNRKELSERGCVGSELIVYGHQPLMVSAQCMLKNTSGCTGKMELTELEDRKKKRFRVKNVCPFCYNVIYNGTATELADSSSAIEKLGISSVRLQFTAESGEQIREITERYLKVFRRGQTGQTPPGEYTRGHFERGVQ